MVFKVFQKTGEELRDIDIKTIEDLIDIIGESKPKKVKDLNFTYNEITIGLMTNKKNERRGYVEIDDKNF